MACRPAWQLFDGSRPDRTNKYVFTALDGSATTVTASGLDEGERVLLLIEDETGDFVPYLDYNGEQVYLDSENPTVIVDPNNTYKLDMSEVDDTSDVIVNSSSNPHDVVSSVSACFTPDGETLGIPVEIVRYRGVSQPNLYRLGTDTRIIVTDGTFTSTCVECCEDSFIFAKFAPDPVIAGMGSEAPLDNSIVVGIVYANLKFYNEEQLINHARNHPIEAGSTVELVAPRGLIVVPTNFTVNNDTTFVFTAYAEAGLTEVNDIVAIIRDPDGNEIGRIQSPVNVLNTSVSLSS